jgi:hypothetical protein
MCGRFACGLAPDVVRRLSTYMNNQTQELTLPPFIDLMSSTQPFRASWNLSPTSTWYDKEIFKTIGFQMFIVVFV